MVCPALGLAQGSSASAQLDFRVNNFNLQRIAGIACGN
jgi:hypothetical protein